LLTLFFFRHRRTHEPQPNGEVIEDVSEGEDLDGGDAQLGSLEEEESPETDHAYLATTMSMNQGVPDMGGMTSMPSQQLISAHGY